MTTPALPLVDHAWLTGPLRMSASLDEGLLDVNGVRGYLSEGDVLRLFEHARDLPAGGTIVEIGSFMGLSAIVLAIGLVESGNLAARIHCVDTWEGSEEHADLDVIRNGRLYELFLANIRDAGIDALVRPLRSPSVDAARGFAPGSVDLLFVDGDHSEAGAYADLQAWWPAVRPCGTVLGHDCTPGGGVERALTRFAQEHAVDWTVVPPPHAQHLFVLRRR